MTPIHALCTLAEALYMVYANPTPMPKITMKINVAKELLFLISITSMI
jgi:hypothetical protein